MHFLYTRLQVYTHICGHSWINPEQLRLWSNLNLQSQSHGFFVTWQLDQLSLGYQLSDFNKNSTLIAWDVKTMKDNESFVLNAPASQLDVTSPERPVTSPDVTRHDLAWCHVPKTARDSHRPRAPLAGTCRIWVDFLSVNFSWDCQDVCMYFHNCICIYF